MISIKYAIFDSDENKVKRLIYTFPDKETFFIWYKKMIKDRQATGGYFHILNVDNDDLDDLLDIAQEVNKHPVCLLCNKDCKQSYSMWSFVMPPEEFCDDFVVSPFVKNWADP